MIGYGSSASGINFTFNSADTFSINHIFNFFYTNAGICDTSGQLLFYTNGIAIENRNHDTLLNSSNFNVGWGQGYYGTDGLGFCQYSIVIPRPNHPNQYYLIYNSDEAFFNYLNPNDTILHQDLEPFNLRYSLIDMTLDNGFGGIDSNEKSIIVLSDTLYLGFITACKHGNGRDWWVIARKYHSNIYYKLLITDLGISLVNSQAIGIVQPPTNVNFDTDIYGEVQFSPDGTKYAMVSPTNSIQYFEFDRCSGLFSNPQNFNFPGNLGVVGVSFSPNSRFMYISNRTTVYQYDTYSSNLASSNILVAQCDSFQPPNFPVYMYFGLHQLAPDGKIYIPSWNGYPLFHVIQDPNSLGISCNVTQHSFANAGADLSVPNYPNYNLGVLQNSICDTLSMGIKEETQLSDFNLFPNPASSSLTISFEALKNEDYEVIIRDLLSQEILHFNKTENNSTLDIGSLPSGVYLLSVQNRYGISTKKFIKL